MTRDTTSVEAGELAHVAFGGRWYHIHQTRCAACRRAILIASRGPRSAIYDRIVIDPSRGPVGDRHLCPVRVGPR